jgi:hypothetical protein
MAFQFSIASRNAWLDAIETTIGASAKLELWDGGGIMPVNCAAVSIGTKLASVACPVDYLAAAANGSKALAGVWSFVGLAAGDAGYFRLVDSAGTTCHIQGSVTATGGGGDMTLDNINIAVDQAGSVTGFTITAGGA